MMIPRSDIPEGMYDHWQSEPFASYMRRLGLTVLGQKESFGYIKRLGRFGFVKYVYTDEEPVFLDIIKAGCAHGIVYWIPYRRMVMPRGWRVVRPPFRIHGIGKGCAVIQPSYLETWNERARRNLILFQKRGGCVREGTREEFCEGIGRSTLTPFFKKSFERKVHLLHDSGLCYFIGTSEKGDVVGGLSVLVYDAISVHMVAFLTPEGRALHVGTGLIDFWYQWAIARKLSFLHFGELRRPGDPDEWDGFSEYKRNFIHYEFHLSDEYWKVF